MYGDGGHVGTHRTRPKRPRRRRRSQEVLSDVSGVMHPMVHRHPVTGQELSTTALIQASHCSPVLGPCGSVEAGSGCSSSFEGFVVVDNKETELAR